MVKSGPTKHIHAYILNTWLDVSCTGLDYKVFALIRHLLTRSLKFVYYILFLFNFVNLCFPFTFVCFCLLLFFVKQNACTFPLFIVAYSSLLLFLIPSSVPSTLFRIHSQLLLRLSFPRTPKRIEN